MVGGVVSSEVAAIDAEAAADWLHVVRVQQGDANGFQPLVEKHQQAVTRLMTRFTRDPARLEELVQTVFIEAWRQIHNFRGDAPFLHWLTVIGTRTGYRFWKTQAKQRQRTTSIELVPDVASKENDTDAARDAAARVHAVLSRLPPRDRLVITLLHLEERTLKEISTLTGWSLAMVKVQAFRARKKLASLLKEATP
jgi:RNA polymerase sigma-70 factor (ECF subfamily)